ncbi:hypothetical protein [Tenacibaculum piscium]|uniref:hypothetical protein n=2 Tax=Tenacibaculum piscium TaxID=1458515 RepID=UPI001F3C3952|nr:hypothetical protein [Tenacibaculum piscium]
MKKHSLRFLTLIFIGVLIYSCQDEIENTPQTELTLSQELASESDGKIILGEKLENPYSVKNMRLALRSLKEKQQKSSKGYSAKTLNDDIDILATDYYVKFWVENDEQKTLLLADSLNLSIIPLDVEIEQEGDYFVDENTEIEKAQWLYTSVVKDYQFHQEINYEKIEDLFLIEPSEPEEIDGDDNEDASTTTTLAGKSSISKSFLYDLEDEALKLTGNYTKSNNEDNSGNNLAYRRNKRRPQGHIRVRNTVTGGNDPVVGVKVKTRRWFKWAKGWTNSQGFYRVNRGYRRSVRYTVVFKNTRGFKIWPSTISISSARYRAGKHSKYGHSITFGTNSVGWRWSTVNNATVKYLDYCTQFGIGKPHSNLRIVANGKSGGGAAPMLRRTWGAVGFRTNSDLVSFLNKSAIFLPLNKLWLILRFVLPDVIIKANASQGTDGVFETTFHELAHTSHFKKVGNGYWVKYINYIITYGAYGDGTGKNAELCALGEAWGFHVGQFLTIQEFDNNNRLLSLNTFENFDPRNRPNNIAKSFYSFGSGWTGWMPCGIMHDLMDEDIDEVRTGFDDNVSGYSIRNIYDALDRGIESPQAFRDRLLSENGNRDEADVRELFEAYHWN